MRVSELKKAMADAGVFFHAKDVVEKLDMITIFINSGRLSLLPSHFESDSPNELGAISTSKTNVAIYDPPKDPVVETVTYDSESEEVNENQQTYSFAKSPPQEMFPSVSTTLNNRQVAEETNSLPHNEAKFSAKRDISEVISSSVSNNSSILDAKRSAPGKNVSMLGKSCASRYQDEVDLATHENVQKPLLGSLSLDPSVTTHESKILGNVPHSAHRVCNSLASESFPSIQARAPMQEGEQEVGITKDSNASMESATRKESDLNSSLDSERTSAVSNVPDCPMRLEQDSEVLGPESLAADARQCPLSGYSISQLKVMARDAKIDLSSCFERSEMVDILVSSGVTGGATVGLSRSNFSGWSVSQLRAVASEVNVDLSQCRDRTEMLDRILCEANIERPHLQNYLRVLSPLMTSTLSQLRSTARQWDVNIRDCLEKEEIIQRLITRANQFGVV